MAGTRYPYQAWLKEKYPLLDEQSFKSSYTARHGAHQQDHTEAASPVTMKPQSAVCKQLQLEMRLQFRHLCALASNRLHDSCTAREFIGFLVLNNGFPVVAFQRQAIVNLAANAVIDLMSVDDFRRDLLSCVTGVLAHSQPARASIRLKMLAAFEALQVSSGTGGISHSKFASILLTALRQELERVNRNTEFQVRLIKLLALYPHPQGDPALQAILDGHQDALVKDAAKTARFHLCSLGRMWEETPSDQLSSQDDRIRRIKQALSDSMCLDQRIQMIFNQIKGAPIDSPDDPRLPYLYEMLSSKSSMRLAAAVAMAHSYKLQNPCPVGQTAIDVLVDTAINGTNSADTLDALSCIELLKQVSPRVPDNIEKYRTLAYLKLHLRTVSTATLELAANRLGRTAK